MDRYIPMDRYTTPEPHYFQWTAILHQSPDPRLPIKSLYSYILCTAISLTVFVPLYSYNLCTAIFLTPFVPLYSLYRYILRTAIFLRTAIIEWTAQLWMYRLTTPEPKNHHSQNHGRAQLGKACRQGAARLTGHKQMVDDKVWLFCERLLSGPE